MRITLKKTTLLLSILLLLLACNRKIEKSEDVFFLIEPFDSKQDSTLKVLLINNSYDNYFLTIDTTQAYNNPFFNYIINNSIIAKPILLDGNDTISLIGISYTPKRLIGHSHDESRIKEKQKSENFYKNYIALDNAIFLKSKSSKYFEIPFQLRYKAGNWYYHYDVEDGEKYVLQLEYQMRKVATEENVLKSRLDSVQLLNFEPYYKKVLSNKVELFTYKTPVKRRLPKI